MRDPLGIVPPDIRARIEREEFVDRSVRAGRALAEELRGRWGPSMDVVFVRHDARDVPDGCIPGRWHVKRNNPPPALPIYMAILAPGGGYRDPDFGVIGELEERNLHRPEVMQRMLAEGRTDQPLKQRERELRKEQRRDVMAEDFRAAKRTRGDGGIKRSFERKRRGD